MVYLGHLIHYWHTNITFGCSVWKDKENNTRKFETVQEMSQHLVSQINKYVGQDDILFHLGDWSFGGIQNIWNFRKQLNVKTIYLVNGNHDQHIRTNKILQNVKWENNFLIDEQDAKSKPTYAQKLFTSTQDYLELTIDGRFICMSHYPMEEWNNKGEEFINALMLHGHSHSTCPIISGRLDVGIDNAFKLYREYKPFSWGEIKKQIKI